MKTINIAPTWSQSVNIFKVLLGERGNAKTQETAWEEIERMAKVADQRNEIARLLSELESMSPAAFRVFKKKVERILTEVK